MLGIVVLNCDNSKAGPWKKPSAVNGFINGKRTSTFYDSRKFVLKEKKWCVVGKCGKWGRNPKKILCMRGNWNGCCPDWVQNNHILMASANRI